jgi:hypothetical protein
MAFGTLLYSIKFNERLKSTSLTSWFFDGKFDIKNLSLITLNFAF